MLDRRTFGGAIAGLAATSALFPVLAQTTSQPPRALASADPAHLMMMAHEGGAFMLRTAQMAMEKATRAGVKQFAQFEVTEQQGLAQSMRLAGHEPTAVNFSGDKAQMIQRLTSASGSAFETAFLEAQEMAHREALDVYMAIHQRNQPPAEKIIGLLATGMIREHLVHLEELRGRT